MPSLGNKNRLSELAKEFLAEVPSIKEPEWQEFHITEFSQLGDPWPSWTAKRGVNYLLNESDQVLYVGKGSSRWGVVYRAGRNIKRHGLNENTTKVGGILFQDADYYWTLWLEEILSHSLNPPLNKSGVSR